LGYKEKQSSLTLRETSVLAISVWSHNIERDANCYPNLRRSENRIKKAQFSSVGSGGGDTQRIRTTISANDSTSTQPTAPAQQEYLHIQFSKYWSSLHSLSADKHLSIKRICSNIIGIGKINRRSHWVSTSRTKQRHKQVTK
jgi:hypothetical protein